MSDKKEENNFLLKNRKGQGLSTNAIIMIILGVVVLIVLILGFTMGWNKLLPFISTTNVDNIKTSCAISCSTESTFDYCSVEREVKDGISDEFSETCYNLANGQEYASRNYGIAECPSIDCTP